MFKRIIAMAVVGVALAACGGGAQAAEPSFKTGNNETFGTEGVWKYDFYLPGGWVKAYHVSGATSDYKDDGTLPGRILQNIPDLVQVSGANSYIHPAYTVRNVCLNGESIASYPNSGVQVRAQDNCAMFNALKAKAK